MIHRLLPFVAPLLCHAVVRSLGPSFCDRAKQEAYEVRNFRYRLLSMLVTEGRALDLLDQFDGNSISQLYRSGLDSVTRIAGFMGVISKVCSMMLSLLVIFTIKLTSLPVHRDHYHFSFVCAISDQNFGSPLASASLSSSLIDAHSYYLNLFPYCCAYQTAATARPYTFLNHTVLVETSSCAARVDLRKM
ncbi:hypothetical protein M378DRAFT_800307 [Amanita muscaria Koide BX008]|uniref:Uncharacterized protein n=1 Tax=Amanita muscaria (strain Koide BX008) TaxID=946122 RepID=A0A0C2X0R3_AMAMK|nr:hypothetical protein M378DRAFT_800307 [Amanita muscaria Koide BX008]